MLPNCKIHLSSSVPYLHVLVIRIYGKMCMISLTGCQMNSVMIWVLSWWHKGKRWLKPWFIYLGQTILRQFLRLWPEGSYEIGSVRLSYRPFILPSGSFLGIGSLVFSETHVIRGPCVVVRDRAEFFEKKFAPKMGKITQKWAKINVFLNLLENLVITFFWIWSRKKFILFAVFWLKSHTWEKFGSWHLGQNALKQSDCSIFKLTLSLEQNDEKAWFLACCCRFIEIKSWLKNIGVGLVKNECGHSQWSKLIFGVLIKIQEI